MCFKKNLLNEKKDGIYQVAKVIGVDVYENNQSYAADLVLYFSDESKRFYGSVFLDIGINMSHAIQAQEIRNFLKSKNDKTCVQLDEDKNIKNIFLVYGKTNPKVK
jgi:hypothetical protein